MALAYPEGECFFTRKALDSSSSDGYHASDPKQFYSHMMVEYVWNHWADSKSVGDFSHPRSKHLAVWGTGWNTPFGAWSNLPFSYGPSEDKISRLVLHELCVNGNVFRDRDNGGGDQSWFKFVPMPTTEERWVWIDLLSYVRGIYFPVAHSVNKDHEDLCSFVQVNFALDRKINIYRESPDIFEEFTTDAVLGLGIHRDLTIGFDVSGLIELLCLPRQLRRNNCYALKLIKVVPNSTLKRIGSSQFISYNNDKSWIDVAKGNFGLDLTWQPAEKTLWAENFIKNTLNLAIGFIPVAGPFLQIMFTVAWTAVAEDGDAAFKAYKDMCPGIDFTDHIIKEIRRTSQETRTFLPEGWQGMGLMTAHRVVDVQSKPKPVDRKMDRSLQFNQHWRTLRQRS